MKYFILFNCFFISSLVFSQINSNHQLIFEYDLSGNQQKREYKNTTIILGDLTEEIQSSAIGSSGTVGDITTMLFGSVGGGLSSKLTGGNF